MEILDAIDALDDLVRGARPVSTGSASSGSGLPKAIADQRGVPYEPSPWTQALVTADELDDVLHHARIVPLTDQVRVERADLGARVATLREQVAGNQRATGVVSKLEAAVAAARPVPLADQIRVAKPRLDDLLGELRVAVGDERP